MNHKGQFFSPDLIIAVLVFVVCLTFFFMGSASITSQINFVEEKNSVDEVAHAVMSGLILSSGSPYNWEAINLSDVNVFGLVESKNVLNNEKVNALFYFIDSDYTETKTKLGLGGYDFKLELIDFNGEIIFESTRDFNESFFELSYDRFVLYNNRETILRGIIAYEK